MSAEVLPGNVRDRIADDEINEFLQRYRLPLFDSIERVPAVSGSPMALLRFIDLASEVLDALMLRIRNMFWRGHTISAKVLLVRDDWLAGVD
ncbi:hypothetical protein QF000_002420 [Paraburkholderia atlantica]